ncbi:MAG: hypothetical protein ACLPWF_23425 [Bryobacteraceae bacterium]
MLRAVGDPAILFIRSYCFFGMSTVIARIHTPEGLVIGADSEQRDGESKELIAHVRKIFWIDEEPAELLLTHAVAGTVEFFTTQTNTSFFNFNEETKKAAKSALLGQPETSVSAPIYLATIATALTTALTSALRSANEKLRVGELQTLIYLDGYLRTKRLSGVIQIVHDKTSDMGIQCYEPDEGIPGGYVSEKLLSALNEGDHRLERHEAAWKTPSVARTLTDALHITEDLVKAHCCATSTEIDERCPTGGGRTQICTIKPGEKIRWVSGFEP